jgi:hypothetical protein
MVGNCFLDDGRGHVGHLANSVHPEYRLPIQNARMSLSEKFVLDSNGVPTRRLFVPGDVGFFPLVAIKDINEGEEVIVDYGRGYWKTLSEWISSPKQKSTAEMDRDERQKKRRFK